MALVSIHPRPELLLQRRVEESWLVKFLVARGCDVNTKLKHNDLPCFVSVDDVALTYQFLILAGADINVRRTEKFVVSAIQIGPIDDEGFINRYYILLRSGIRLNEEDLYDELLQDALSTPRFNYSLFLWT